MKKYLLLALPAICLTAWGASKKLPSDFFARQSSLSTGHWVKIAVDSTGVQRLSYDRLRSMGFDEPEKVAVFGRGLTPRPDNFIDSDDRICVESDLTPTPVMTGADCLYFFGVGPAWQTFVEPEDDTDPHFERRNKPVYADKGYYLLTDALPRTEMLKETMPTPEVPDSIDPDSVAPLPRVALSTGYSYLLNDNDLSWGFHNSGQIFMGEKFTQQQRSLTWTHRLPHALSSSPISLQAAIYTDDEAKANTMTLHVGSVSQTAAFIKEDAAQWTNLFPSVISSQLSGTQCQIRAVVSGSSPVSKAAVDFWLLSYPADSKGTLGAGLPTAVVTPSDTIAAIAAGTLTPTAMAWNVADPTRPTVMPLETDTTDNAGYILSYRTPGEAAPRPILFDTATELSTPSSWETIGNTDLHSRAVQGADLLIITIPALKEQAERIARLHSDIDGISVMVACVGDIYNEYNSGQPSVMAYKSLIRQLHDAAPAKHLDVLLFGPLKGDCRGLFSPSAAAEDFIIAYQSDFIPQKGDSHNINDFLGILDDHISLRPEYCTISVGVGILPCLSAEEATLAADKIERYLTEPDFAEHCNRMLGAGGCSDFLTHTTQAIEIQNETQVVYDNSFIYTPFFTDATPVASPLDSFTELLNEGFPLFSYMGHGGPVKIDKEPGLLYMKGQGKTLSNKTLSFGIFGMCDASSPDRRARGASESMLLESENGLIGGIMSTRTAYSNQNSTLTRYFINALRNPSSSSIEVTHAKTVGQAYAEARSRMRTLHENTFSLFCDPALKIAIPTLRMAIDDNLEASLTPGKRVTVTGKIVSSKGTPLSDFNGRVVARLMAPAVNTSAPNPTLVSKQTLTDAQYAKVPPIVYDNRVIATYYGEVKDGRWEVTIDPADSPYLHDGVTTSLYLSTWDADSHTGAAARWLVNIAGDAAAPENADTSAPTVEELAYDPASRSIRFRVADDRTLGVGADILHGNGVTLTIDGRKADLAGLYSVIPGEPITIEGSLPCDNLANGLHSAVLKAEDYAGNTSSLSTSFTVGGADPTCALSTESNYTNAETITFTAESFDGSTPSGRLMIASHDGTVRNVTEFEGGVITIHLNDERGARLPQGVYKAWITGGAPAYGYSRPVTFAVLNPAKGQ